VTVEAETEEEAITLAGEQLMKRQVTIGISTRESVLYVTEQEK